MNPPRSAATPDSPAPPHRGVTVIRDRVVERIAARVVSELDLATGAPPELLGMRVGPVRAGSPARVDATVSGDLVGVRIAMSVRWPAPVRRVTRNVRRQVTERLARLTGLRVGWVDIDVTALPGRALPERSGR